MLTKLAIWWLRKTGHSYMINFRFFKPITGYAKSTLYLYDNNLANGTSFKVMGNKTVTVDDYG